MRLAGATPRPDDAPWLDHLPAATLAAMLDVGREVLEWRRILAKTGDTVVGVVLRHEGPFYLLDHYPKGDVFDPDSHAQWYYHAHDKKDRPGEHGHFHTFIRGGGMPRGIEPAQLPDFEPKPDRHDLVCHLIAVSMDRSGWPMGLFTTNRWVTGETWYAARDVAAMLDRFDVKMDRPAWSVNRWLTGLLRLFRPHIEELLQAARPAPSRVADAPPERQRLRGPPSRGHLAGADRRRGAGASARDAPSGLSPAAVDSRGSAPRRLQLTENAAGPVQGGPGSVRIRAPAQQVKHIAVAVAMPAIQRDLAPRLVDHGGERRIGIGRELRHALLQRRIELVPPGRWRQREVVDRVEAGSACPLEVFRYPGHAGIAGVKESRGLGRRLGGSQEHSVTARWPPGARRGRHSRRPCSNPSR